MEREYYHGTGWEVTTENGETYFAPDDLSEDDARLVVPGGKVATVRAISGWFGRWTTPGYLDCTDWCYSTSKRDLMSQLSA